MIQCMLFSIKRKSRDSSPSGSRALREEVRTIDHKYLEEVACQLRRKLEKRTADSLKLRDLNSSASVIVPLYDYSFSPCRCLDYPMLELPQAEESCLLLRSKS